MRLEAAGNSNIGLKWEINQDAFCVFYNGEVGLFAVGDGMLVFIQNINQKESCGIPRKTVCF